MKDSPFDNTLLASLRALEDVVAPALEPGNPLAHEQLQLVCKFLKFMRQRVGHSAELAHAELQAAQNQALAVAAHARDCPAPLRQALDDALEPSRGLLWSSHAQLRQLEVAAGALNAAVAAVVRYANGLPPHARQAIERAVLAHAKQALDVRRSWLLPLGLDPDPTSVRSFDAVTRGH